MYMFVLWNGHKTVPYIINLVFFLAFVFHFDFLIKLKIYHFHFKHTLSKNNFSVVFYILISEQCHHIIFVHFYKLHIFLDKLRDGDPVSCLVLPNNLHSLSFLLLSYLRYLQLSHTNGPQTVNVA